MPRASRYGLAGLYKDADGRFRIDHRYRDPRTGAVRRYAEKLPVGVRLAEAKEKTRTIIGALEAGTFKKDDRARLKAALGDYLEWRKTHGRTDADKHEKLAERLVDFFGDVAIDDLVPFTIERYKAKRVKDGAAPATVNRELAFLKHFFKVATSSGQCDRLVAAALREVPRLKEPPGRVRYLSEDERTKLLDALANNTRVANVAITALLTGTRQGELLGLRVEAVDLEHRELVLMKTKTNRVRRVPIHADLVPLLERLIKASKSGFVFESRRLTRFSGGGFRASWRRLIREVVTDFRFHDCRHDAATALRRAGVGLDVVQRVLGHANISMTTRYAHVGDDAAHAAIAALPATVRR